MTISIVNAHAEGEVGNVIAAGVIPPPPLGWCMCAPPAKTARPHPRSWITGTSEITYDPTDPWPEGDRLSDTWPMMP